MGIERNKYPLLAIIARRFLAILTTLASIEFFFSQGALITTKLRNRINKDTFRYIICLIS